MVEKKYDPYMIDKAALNQMKNDMSMTSSGLICPKRNKAIGEPCHVCDYIQSQVWAKQFPEKHPARNWAAQKGAKATFFLNVVFPEKPDEVKILEIGSKAGSQIFDGINKMGWTDILHPKKNMGREMLLTKSKKDGFPFYTISPDLNKADWEVKKGTLAESFNLSNLISMIQNNELTEENHMKASTMKEGETIRFRILPPWNDDAGNRNFMTVIWRHWGVSQDQIDGNEGINWQDVEIEEEKPQSNTLNKAKSVSNEVHEKKEERDKRPKCFGNEAYYDPEDEDCTPAKCAFVDECLAKIKG